MNNAYINNSHFLKNIVRKKRKRVKNIYKKQFLYLI